MSGIGPKNRILESARRIAAAIALLVVANGGLAWAQGAPPLPFNAPVPGAISVVLRPIAGDPDAEIVRAYAARNHAKLREDVGIGTHYDIEMAFVGRSKIAPSSEPQILVLLIDPNEPLNFRRGGTRPGFAITKTGDEWVELTGLYGYVDGAFGIVYVATEPFPARLFNPKTDEYDIAIIVNPENEGRRTLIWGESGLYWNGTKWDSYCWRPCD
jgi:hypothetical protein